MKEKMFRNYYQAWWHTFYLINLHGVDTVHCYGYVVIYEKGKTLPACLVPVLKMTTQH